MRVKARSMVEFDRNPRGNYATLRGRGFKTSFDHCRPDSSIVLQDLQKAIAGHRNESEEHQPRPQEQILYAKGSNRDEQLRSASRGRERTTDGFPRRSHSHSRELYKDEKTGPFPMAAFSMIILGWTEGEQYSGTEISEMLSEAGFGNIQVEPAKAYG
jgi:hypothetical protein